MPCYARILYSSISKSLNQCHVMGLSYKGVNTFAWWYAETQDFKFSFKHTNTSAHSCA